jgi:DNA-binding SARP family transcriptional activator/tetratricopeptide (TPR) repeat protein
MELRTLGTVQLDAPARPEARAVGTQPKRLALLVYLALADPQGPKRRDALLALLWPESDQDKGRQVLRQTVYLLRQSLGPDSIVSRSDEDLELDPRAVSCDARRFEALIAAGELRAALELYRGDFLDGFFVPGVSQEFEEWVASTRKRLRGLASTAAWTITADDERNGHASSALHWARRATQLDPDNEAGIRDLMLLHRRLGDRIGALREYQGWVARLKRDLGVGPSAELARLAVSLRDDSGGSPSPTETPDMQSRAQFEPPVPRALEPALLPARSSARRYVWIAAGMIAIAALSVGGLNMRGRAAPLEALLAVGPIMDVVSQDSSAESLVAGDLLATSLARLSELHVIPTMRLYDVQAQLRAAGEPATFLSAARQAGASRILSGSIHRVSGGVLRFDGQITALAQGTVVYAVRAEGKDLFELVDRTTEALAQRLGISAPVVSIADVTTHSFVAYRLYQEGLRAFYASDLRTAQGLFRAAEAEDSTFAMATYFDGMASITLGQPDGPDLLLRAARLALHAPDRERLLIRYRVAAQHQSAEAVPVAETLSARYPNDLDAMIAVAALKQRAGDWAGAAAKYRAAILQDSLSLHVPTARCIACEAYEGLWGTHIYGDSMAAAERTIREWTLRQGKGRSRPTDDLLSIALERQDRFAEVLPLWRDVAPPASSLRRAWIAIRKGDYAVARDTLKTLERVPGLSVETSWWTALALRNEGQPGAALKLRDLAPPMRATALFEAGRYREAAAIFEAALRDWRAGDPRVWPRRLPWQMVHLATALSAARDTNRLAALADSAQRIGAASFFGRDPPLHHYVRGLLWLARGDTIRAANAFRASIWSWTDGYTRANYELAKALFALGRAPEAVYPLQAALRGDLQSANLYLTRTEVHALLARVFDAAGMADSAALYRGRAERAWAQAEPDLPARKVIASLRPRAR